MPCAATGEIIDNVTGLLRNEAGVKGGGVKMCSGFSKKTSVLRRNFVFSLRFCSTSATPLSLWDGRFAAHSCLCCVFSVEKSERTVAVKDQ